MSFCVPNAISWSITDNCNLKCKHCYSSKIDEDKYDMSYEKVMEVIRLLDNYGIFRITLTGGEPLMRKDIFDIIRELKKRAFCVEINTNGTLINKDISKKLKELDIDGVRISLDGSNKYSHDKFRGIKGAFDKSIKAIEILKEDNHRVNVTTIPNKLNLDEMSSLFNIIDYYDIEEWHFFRLLATGSAINNKELILNKEEYIRVMKWISSIDKKNPKVRISFNDPIYSLINENDRITGGCGAGKLYLGMNTKGDFSLCPSMPMTIGNIFEENLEDIFVKKIVRKARNNSLIEECSVCKYKEKCGGCCSASYSIYGNDFTEDPFCIKDIIEGEKL
ncbi:radical SAM/SPASM domain-containing protein [Sporosalibacterium faouarense]|uniref:radical SAM/SPASM domain-containing protein n=1 Tax=Sporosalibacterium faouarense TaxID=516123 RepID=UPI00192C7158|nr:radical SAM protein [Sporosalibacterium faouarense]